jgi:ribonucleoside-triphosphate reductase
MIHIAKVSLEIKRKVLDDFADRGLYPYSAYYLKDVKEHTGSYWTNHFSTVGIIGMNESLLNFKGIDIGTEEGNKFANKVMDFIREELINIQQETGNIYNLEATPAEGTTYSLGLKDKNTLKGCNFVNGCDIPYYTNSTHLPVNYTDDMFELLDLQDELQTKYTGGTVVHLFLGEEIKDPNIVKNLIRKVCENYRLPYFSITPTFSSCEHHGYISGEHHVCPTCDKPTDVYSRVVGFYRPIKAWNDAKSDEFKVRKTFK